MVNILKYTCFIHSGISHIKNFQDFSTTSNKPVAIAVQYKEDGTSYLGIACESEIAEVLPILLKKGVPVELYTDDGKFIKSSVSEQEPITS